MLRLIGAIALLAACASTTAEREPTKADAAVAETPAVVPDAVATDEPKGEAITVVGVIHQDGERVCDDNGHETWVDLHYVAGFTPLVLDEAMTQVAATLHRKAAVVVGHVEPRVTTLVRSQGECPQYQMRSDMVVTAEGIRTPRGPRAAAGVAAQRVTAFDGLNVARAGDKVMVALTNTFAVPLAEKLAITVHYEGCFGKPGTDARASVRDTPLPPGASWSIEAPAFIEHPEGQRGRQLYRAASIELTAKGDAIAFDFDAAFHELGAEGVPCPRD